jgi:VanZ family protein
VPLGFLAVRATGRRGSAIAVAALFSALIESVQYFIGRSADVDDVLLNTARGAGPAPRAGVTGPPA